MKRFRSVPLVLILALLVGCAGRRETNAFKALESARYTYTAMQKVAISLQERGLVSTRMWNDRVVPLDNKLHINISRAYSFLRLYIAMNQAVDLQQYMQLMREITQQLAEFQTLLNELEAGSNTPAANSRKYNTTGGNHESN